MEPEGLLVESEAILEHPKDFDAIRDKWSRDLRYFIDRTLRPIIPNAKERRKYTSQREMKVWERAFTHPSFDPRRDHNYDVLEFMGDRALKYAFNKYLLRLEPRLDQGHLTTLDNRYMAKKEQPGYGKKLGLDKYVRIVGTRMATSKVIGDLFESFIGALDQVSDDIEDGLGIVNVFNFMVNFFKDFRFELPKERGGHVKTNVQQIFKRFGLEPPEEIYTEDDGGQITFIVKATKEIEDFLASDKPGEGFNIHLRSPILGQAKGKDKKQARDAAYANALETLRSYGVTSESAGLMKDLKDFAHEALLPYKEELEMKLIDDGYKRVFFDKPKKLHTNEYKTIVLMGEDAYGRAWRLGDITIPKGEDEMIGKVKLIQNYIAEERKGREDIPIKRKESYPRSRDRPTRKEPSPRSRDRPTRERPRSRPEKEKEPRVSEKVESEGKTSPRKRPRSRSEKEEPRVSEKVESEGKSSPRKRPRSRPEKEKEPRVSEKVESEGKTSPRKRPRSRPEKEKEPEETEEEEVESELEERRKELTSLRVVELKNILRKLNLKVSGRKTELIDRILKAEFP